MPDSFADPVHIALKPNQWHHVAAVLNLEPTTRAIATTITTEVLDVCAARLAADIADAEYDLRGGV